MTTHNGFNGCCVVAFFNKSAVTETVTPAFLKIAKISNSLHSCWKDIFPPSYEEKISPGPTRPDAQVEQTQRIIDQRSSICSRNWAKEFSAHLVTAGHFYRQTYCSFHLNGNETEIFIGRGSRYRSVPDQLLCSPSSVLQVYCANVSFNRKAKLAGKKCL